MGIYSALFRLGLICSAAFCLPCGDGLGAPPLAICGALHRCRGAGAVGPVPVVSLQSALIDGV